MLMTLLMLTGRCMSGSPSEDWLNRTVAGTIRGALSCNEGVADLSAAIPSPVKDAKGNFMKDRSGPMDASVTAAVPESCSAPGLGGADSDYEDAEPLPESPEKCQPRRNPPCVRTPQAQSWEIACQGVTSVCLATDPEQHWVLSEDVPKVVELYRAAHMVSSPTRRRQGRCRERHRRRWYSVQAVSTGCSPGVHTW